MNTVTKTAGIPDDVIINTKMKISALWVAMMLLYIYADILSFFRPGQLTEIMDGRMGPLPVTQASLLTASILMIIPAVMVFLSVPLKPTVNRWTNITLGVLYTLVNIGNLIGETWIYYLAFGVVEIVISLLIVWNAWKWSGTERGPQ